MALLLHSLHRPRRRSIRWYNVKWPPRALFALVIETRFICT